MTNLQNIRVRFAPSPTGPLHVGNARTALFNWLFVRSCQGKFVLRIEDTDAERSTREAEDQIIKDLKWLGLDWEEGTNVGGDFGPYRQSERTDIYRKYVDQLLNEDKAYFCFCSNNELEEKRKLNLKKGLPPKYDGKCRGLSKNELKQYQEKGVKPVVRFKIEKGSLTFNDIVKGKTTFDINLMGDLIIVRSDEAAVYNFASVVDDGLMKITHIIRGEDHLPNTPFQILLYRSLGFPVPGFAHLGMVLGTNRSPLSKRHGDVSLRHYREAGFLPSALFNFLSLIGWSSEDRKEIMGVEEIVDKFTLKRVAKSAAVFDISKLTWMNSHYIKELPSEKLLSLLIPYIEKQGYEVKSFPKEWLVEVCKTIQHNIDTLEQAEEYLGLFLSDKTGISKEVIDILKKDSSCNVIKTFQEEIADIENLDASAYKAIVKSVSKKLNVKGRNLYMPIRASVTGSTNGPELDKIIALLGKKKVLSNIDKMLTLCRSDFVN